MQLISVPFFILLMFLCNFRVSCEETTNKTIKLHVAVYYEALCPDSSRFIANQLGPTYGHFKDYIDVELIPFGKSESFLDGNRTEFSCQHGPAECTGNKIQSCVLKELHDDPAEQIKYVVCQMDTRNGISEWTGKACATLSNVTWSNVEECSKGPIGTQLQLDAEKATHLIAKPYPGFIPTIVYNRTYDTYKQRRTLYDFKDVLCHELVPHDGQDLPSVCY